MTFPFSVRPSTASWNESRVYPQRWRRTQPKELIKAQEHTARYTLIFMVRDIPQLAEKSTRRALWNPKPLKRSGYLSKKSFLAQVIIAYIKMVESNLSEEGCLVIRRRCDGDRENYHAEVQIVACNKGIKIKLSPAYEPERNVFAEGLVQKIWTWERVLLQRTKITFSLWGEEL